MTLSYQRNPQHSPHRCSFFNAVSSSPACALHRSHSPRFKLQPTGSPKPGYTDMAQTSTAFCLRVLNRIACMPEHPNYTSRRRKDATPSVYNTCCAHSVISYTKMAQQKKSRYDRTPKKGLNNRNPHDNTHGHSSMNAP